MSAGQILVVEDERMVATAIKHELEQFGYGVSGIASSAEEAVEKTVRDRPDLVLVDIHLKGDQDGIEAAREIHRRCRVPVVYLSAFADPETLARAAETEAFGYLIKPYEEQELQTTIEMALAKYRAEQRLEETERWLAATLDGIDDAVIATDPDNQIHFLNLAAVALTGCRKEDAVGAPFAAVCNLRGERGRIVLDDLADKAVSESRVVGLPGGARIVSRSGHAVLVEGSLAPIYDHRGAFLGMALTLRNISARLERERVRQRSEEQTRQAQKLEVVRRLAGGVAHHLNNLLTVILCNASLARLVPVYEDGLIEALNRVETAGQRAADLIRGLSVFSGSGRPQLRRADLNTLVPKLMTEIKPHLDPRVKVLHGSDTSSWPVAVDEGQLSQALLNLCLNAQDAMPEGGQLTLESKDITLTEEDMENHPDGRPDEFVRLRVSDTGGGMTPEVFARLFEPFFTTKEQRVGLGLAFVFGFVEQHHGWIECKSEVGRGARFDLYFPRFEVNVNGQSAPARPVKPRAARPTILVAESDQIVRDFGRRILEGEGYRVLVAEDGIQAVETFQQAPERIDLAIIDLTIPRLSADAVFEQLRDLDPNVEVIFSSGYFAEDTCEGGGDLLGVISKPYLLQNLFRMVERALASRPFEVQVAQKKVTS